MSSSRANGVLRYIRKVASAQCTLNLPDHDLLQGFIERRDEAAFATLVRRYGPMVMCLCRRILGNEHDAEDALQATFLVLSRKAVSLRPQESLGGWLYSVAYRVAQKARVAAARRHKHEGRAAGMQVADRLAELTLREGHEILDQELARMPDKFRAPLVLCYLQGLTRDEAAHQLGLTPGTLKGRLEQARERLRARLAARGLALSGALLASLFCEGPASAAVPALLVASTVQAAICVATNSAIESVVSTEVAALTEGVMKTMFLTKLKAATAALLMLALVTAGGVLSVYSSLGAERSAVPSKDVHANRQGRFATALEVDQTEKQEQPQGPPTWKIGPILQVHGDRLWEVAFSPDGKWLASSSSDKSVIVWDMVKRKLAHTLAHSSFPNSVAFAPDNKTLITSSGGPDGDYLIQFWDVETGREQATLEGHKTIPGGLCFAGNGKILVSTTSSTNREKGPGSGEVVFWNLETRKKIAAMKCERIDRALFSHDGKKMVTSHSIGTVKLWEFDEKLFAAKREKVLLKGFLASLRASPDRKTFVIGPAYTDDPSIDLWNFETEQLVRSFVHKEVQVRSVAFSPDGKTLATGCVRKVKTGNGNEQTGEVKFWDVATGQEKQTLGEKLGPVNSVAFSPDGKTLAVGLHHKDNLKLKGESLSFEQPAEGYAGAVVLCELKTGKP